MGYPKTVESILKDIKFKDETIRVMMEFKKEHPWRGSSADKRYKLANLHHELCKIYNKETVLSFETPSEKSSDQSSYCPATDRITLRGRLSVVTYLHEFAHALGRGEYGACRWSVNLFRKCFPESYGRLRHMQHTLRKKI